MQVAQRIREGKQGYAMDFLAYPLKPLRRACRRAGILCATVFCILLASCTSPEQKGEALFTKNCTSCHNFQTNSIGPLLGGVTDRLSVEQIHQSIRNPKGTMPSFKHFGDDDIDNIIAYLRTKPAPPKKEFTPDGTELKDPIPEKIQMSDLVIDIHPVATIPPSSKEGQKTRICKLDYRPDTKETFVLDLRGKLYRLAGDGPKVYLDLAKEFPKFIDKPGLATGFGSFAFHPGFAKNGLLYTTHTESPGSGVTDFAYADSIKVTLQWVLSEWKDGKHRELFRANMVQQIHGVQEIAFNPLAKPGDEDYGLLYIGVGDGGAVEIGYPFIAHNVNNIWGSILRIDPQGNNSKNHKYGIPKSNPFDNEVFAVGFRNPHRISWSKKGEMIVSNVGHRNIESLYVVTKGHDYGWPEREGGFKLRYYESMDFVYPKDTTKNIALPFAQYDHDEGNAISGGYEYWGNKIKPLVGKYVFGDIVNGRVFYVEMSDVEKGEAPIKQLQLRLNGEKKTLRELTGEDKVDVRFGRDHSGELYILTKPDGKVYGIVGPK